MTHREPTVVAVVGSPRSGSTVLGHVVGAGDGWWFAGELGHLPRLWARNRPCSCGAGVRSCPFWQRVYGDAVLGPADRDLLAATHQDLLRRPHPGLRALTRRQAPPDERAVDVWARVVDALAVAADSSHLVDSTKKVAHPALLADAVPGRLRLLHVVRAPVAVGASVAARIGDGPGTTGRLLRSSAAWVLDNLAVEATAARRDLPRRVVRYEQFARDPEAVRTTTATWAGGATPTALRTYPRSPHTLAGSPSTRTPGELQVAPRRREVSPRVRAVYAPAGGWARWRYPLDG